MVFKILEAYTTSFVIASTMSSVL